MINNENRKIIHGCGVADGGLGILCGMYANS